VIAVVGADGVVGKVLAVALDAHRIVFRSPGPGEIAIGDADEPLRSASVVINASGFRVRPGLSANDYRRSHAEAVAPLVPRLSKGALLVQISSASVLGKSTTRPLGNGDAGRPESFGCPAYALAKREAEETAREAAAVAGVRLVILRPAILYGPSPDGMLGTLLAIAGKGIHLRLVPAAHRHHLCSFPLLVEAVKALAGRGEAVESPLVLADPFFLTNADLAEAVASVRPARLTIPFPAALAGGVLRRFPRSASPPLDLRTWGEILAILALDTVYDPAETYRLLAIDPARFTRARTWKRLVRGLEADA
jgi:nucleoside-diphosphate-sugar epimerase